MRKTKYKGVREWANLVSVIGIIGFVFIYLVIGLFKSPGPTPARDGANQEAQQDAPVRSSEIQRFFNRTMNIHERIAGALSSTGKADRVENYGELVPKLDDMKSRGGGVDSFQEALMTAPMPAVPREKRREEDEDENDNKTGWGWLADDIESGRESKKKAPGDSDDNSQAMTEEERNEDDKSTETILSDQNRSEKTTYFMDQSFEKSSNQENAGLIPFRENKDEGTGLPDMSSGNDRTSDQGRDNMNQEGGRAEASGTSPFELRDPFQLNENSPRWLTQTPTAASVFGFREQQDANGQSSGFTQPIEPAISATESFSVVPSPDGFSAAGLPAASYASDSMFNSSEGYTPAGIDASSANSSFSSGDQSDMFSAGSLGGAIESSILTAPSTPVEPPAAFDRSGPSALPW